MDSSTTQRTAHKGLHHRVQASLVFHAMHFFVSIHALALRYLESSSPSVWNQRSFLEPSALSLALAFFFLKGFAKRG